MPRLDGLRERMHAAIYFNFDFRDGAEIKPVMEGVINSVNFPGLTEVHDGQRGKTRFRLMGERAMVGLGFFLCPHLSMGKNWSPEVITHIGPSKLVVIVGDKEVWDFPPGALSLQTEGRMKPAKSVSIPPRADLRIEWRIIDNDMPPPIVFTVGFEGLLTRDVL